MAAPVKLLVVDDDPQITSALARGLSLHGYAVETDNRADTALAHLLTGGFAAAVVDVMLGADSGLDLVRRARAAGVQIPVVMLSALSEVEHRAAGLEAGADDYIVKPFSFDELAARLKVQQHRVAETRPAPARMSDPARSLSCGARTVQLTDREYSVLALLAKHCGSPVPRGEIFDALWAGTSGSENVVDVYVGYLRKKLKPSMDFGFEIRTVRHRGFVLDGIAPLRSGWVQTKV
ncbi:response regulator transcription factor [Celeribacter neptunius]|uniref:DNA-binding response regulator, OmpR family, contains REC and winged-helix (WHTH) domain n=1 Tax=Celeribacter neptunius TaxID=588602 RepID=A0A1I3W030_9RHOB|nr:response regulator transcription factor [Celeribacter neptunius]SFK00974.1 DNA-binding response regulator, OmpR family, contains REC and winged-helix (wHTH) domain [Celeribacter neptunius]